MPCNLQTFDRGLRTRYPNFFVGFSAPLAVPHSTKNIIINFLASRAWKLVITAYNYKAFLINNSGPITQAL
jgi:hypothetical protein